MGRLHRVKYDMLNTP